MPRRRIGDDRNLRRRKAQSRRLGRLEWPDEIGVEWQLPHGELFRLLRRSGFEVINLVELYPPDDAAEHSYYDTFSLEWSRKWPSEEIWVAEKRR